MNFLYVIPVFILGFAFMWLFATGLISLIGGWHSLAKSHPAPERSMGLGREFGFQSVFIGLLGSYRSCVKVSVFAEGILLRPIILYRFNHRPVFLTWDRMTDPHEEAVFLLPVKRLVFRVGGKKVSILGGSVPEIWKKLRGEG